MRTHHSPAITAIAQYSLQSLLVTITALAVFFALLRVGYASDFEILLIQLPVVFLACVGSVFVDQARRWKWNNRELAINAQRALFVADAVGCLTLVVAAATEAIKVRF